MADPPQTLAGAQAPAPPPLAARGSPPSPPGPLEGPGSRFLRTAAYFVILIAGLRAAASLLIPIMAAILLAVLCMPPIRWLRRHRVPDLLALPLVILGLLVAAGAVTGIVGTSIRGFRRALPTYEVRINELVAGWLWRLHDLGLEIDTAGLTAYFDSGALMRLVATTAEAVIATFSNVIVILLIAVFILLEAHGFGAKVRLAKRDPSADLSNYEQLTKKVYDYVFLKTGLSLLTGLLAGLLTAALGVDFPILWGLVAFLFNYVPNIGSIIAAVPPILLALILNGPLNALLVALGFLAINLGIGNVLEPRLMGRRLGLSPLVVLLSLIFWSWVWGPVGMILSLPLTMMVKILLEASEDYRPAAVLLGPVDDRPAGEADR